MEWKESARHCIAAFKSWTANILICIINIWHFCMTKSWQVCLWSKQVRSSRHANGPSNRHSLQLCYPMQHQPYLLVHARQCCHILGEQASCPAESLPQTHVHIHKTCYKFFREVKDSYKQQTSCFTIFWPAVPSVSNCQQWTLQQAKRAPESKELKAMESTNT